MKAYKFGKENCENFHIQLMCTELIFSLSIYFHTFLYLSRYTSIWNHIDIRVWYYIDVVVIITADYI